MTEEDIQCISLLITAAKEAVSNGKCVHLKIDWKDASRSQFTTFMRPFIDLDIKP